MWRYPRPPALRRCHEPIQVILGGALIADTTQSWQVLETSHPPTYYRLFVPERGVSVDPMAGVSAG